MKRCPRCNARFDDERVECAYDGAALVDASDPMLGRTLADRYHLVQRIGAGGMGTVYRAHHLLLRRDVALKLLSSELTRDPVMRERFLREAQATHMLRHPNIVEMFDVAVDGSRVFLVMELLAGESLATWLGSGTLDVVRSLRVVRAVVAALARAHSLGVVHRDIKPENVFVDRSAEGDWTVKVLDFGIAYLRHEARLTAPGEVFGTPEYLAPEIARGEECVPASDLYAVGVMLFEMLTGALPFDGDLVQLIAHHRDTPAPSARARNPAVPEALDALVMRLMHKDPAWRFGSTEELGAILDDMLEELDPPQSAVRPRLRTPRPPGEAGREAEENRRTQPQMSEAPLSLATLRQRRATFEAAVAAAYREGPPGWISEALRALSAAMLGLDALESQRRVAVREMTERTRIEQEQREVLQDALLVASRAEAAAESSLGDAGLRLSIATARERDALNNISSRWSDLGTVPPLLNDMDEACAQRIEALGAEAARWRRARGECAAERARHAEAAAMLEAAQRTARESRAALDALEDAAQRGEHELRARAAQTSAELDARYRVVREQSDALLAHLRELPVARGLISWMSPLTRGAGENNRVA